MDHLRPLPTPKRHRPSTTRHLSFNEMLDTMKGLLAQLYQLQARTVDYHVEMAELFTEATILLDPSIMQIVRQARQKSKDLATTATEFKEEEMDQSS